MADTKTAAPPVVSRLNCVYLYVRDVPRSVAFYRDVLGLPIQIHDRDPHWAEVTFPDGVRFALHKTERPTQMGTLSINLEVANIDAAVARVRAAGAKVGEIEREFWGSAADVEDPDGYRITLFQPPSG